MIRKCILKKYVNNDNEKIAILGLLLNYIIKKNEEMKSNFKVCVRKKNLEIFNSFMQYGNLRKKFILNKILQIFKKIFKIILIKIMPIKLKNGKYNFFLN